MPDTSASTITRARTKRDNDNNPLRRPPLGRTLGSSASAPLAAQASAVGSCRARGQQGGRCRTAVSFWHPRQERSCAVGFLNHRCLKGGRARSDHVEDLAKVADPSPGPVLALEAKKGR